MKIYRVVASTNSVLRVANRHELARRRQHEQERPYARTDREFSTVINADTQSCIARVSDILHVAKETTRARSSVHEVTESQYCSAVLQSDCVEARCEND